MALLGLIPLSSEAQHHSSPLCRFSTSANSINLHYVLAQPLAGFCSFATVCFKTKQLCHYNNNFDGYGNSNVN